MGINTDKMVFVFGSNLAGRHGAGAARYARDYRQAQYGVGVGRTGQCYAIPTKSTRLETLGIQQIYSFVKDFLIYAQHRPEMIFQVTCIGCGLAGLKNEEIAPLFIGSPKNCYFDTAWKSWLGEDANYWGTYNG